MEHLCRHPAVVEAAGQVRREVEDGPKPWVAGKLEEKQEEGEEEEVVEEAHLKQMLNINVNLLPCNI